MSIEALLENIWKALDKNSEALDRLEASLVGRTPKTPKEEKAEPKAVKEEVKEDQPTENPKKDIKQAEESKPDPADDIPEFGVTYETVRNLVLKLAGGGKREEIKALNAKHGIANLKVLLDKEDDFSTVNDQAKLEAVYAELQALEG